MKITPVKGTNDYLPNEVEIRDYLQNEILKVYVANGFEHITTPIIEDIENLDKSDGGENLNLIFKIMKRGDKLEKAVSSLQENPKTGTACENEIADMGLRYDLTLPLSRYFANNKCKLIIFEFFHSQITLMNCLDHLKHFRWDTYGELIVRREDVSVSLCSVILILSVLILQIQRLNLFLQQLRPLRLLA